MMADTREYADDGTTRGACNHIGCLSPGAVARLASQLDNTPSAGFSEEYRRIHKPIDATCHPLVAESLGYLQHSALTRRITRCYIPPTNEARKTQQSPANPRITRSNRKSPMTLATSRNLSQPAPQPTTTSQPPDRKPNVASLLPSTSNLTSTSSSVNSTAPAHRRTPAQSSRISASDPSAQPSLVATSGEKRSSDAAALPVPTSKPRPSPTLRPNLFS